MIHRIVTFFGNKIAHSGIPTSFHRYLIIADNAPWLGDNTAIASIMPVTRSPTAHPGNYRVDGSIEDAVNTAVEALKELHKSHRLGLREVSCRIQCE